MAICNSHLVEAYRYLVLSFSYLVITYLLQKSLMIFRLLEGEISAERAPTYLDHTRG